MFFCLTVAFLVAQVCSLLAEDAVDEGIENWKATETERLKRQVIQSLQPDPGTVCMSICVNSLATNLGSKYSETANGMINPIFFEKQEFDKFCKIYKDGLYCLNSCQAAPVRETIDIAFASINFLCMERYEDFISHSPCFKASNSDVRNVCDSKCGNNSVILDFKRQEMEAKQRGDLNGMSQSMNKMCSFLNCQFSCQGPIMTEICRTTGPGDFMNEFIMDTLTQLAGMMDRMGAHQYWPISCRKIVAGQFSYGPEALPLPPSLPQSPSVGPQLVFSSDNANKKVSVMQQPSQPENPWGKTIDYIQSLRNNIEARKAQAAINENSVEPLNAVNAPSVYTNNPRQRSSGSAYLYSGIFMQLMWMLILRLL